MQRTVLTVALADYEVARGYELGCRRYYHSRKMGFRHRAERNGNNNSWSQDIDGAIGELAYSKLTRLHWRATVGRDPLPDVGEWEVKSTPTLHGHLIIPKTERSLVPHQRYALMIIDDCDHASFVGWCTAAEAIAKATDKPNAYWMHQGDLHDVHEANLEFFDIHEEQALADYVQRRLSAVAA